MGGMSIADRTRADLAAAGHEASPSPIPYFTLTGFWVEPSTSYEGAARVTVTALFTGQDKYDHWNEACALANQLMDVLQAGGYGFEEETDREPNSVFHAFPPEPARAGG